MRISAATEKVQCPLYLCSSLVGPFENLSFRSFRNIYRFSDGWGEVENKMEATVSLFRVRFRVRALLSWGLKIGNIPYFGNATPSRKP